jgi:hypothetical protein
LVLADPDATARYVHELFTSRSNARAPHLQRMERVRDTYNGDIIVPLPEMDKEERVAVANLIFSGIDQLSGRIASVAPQQWWPSLKPGVRGADRRSNTRRIAAVGWWQHNRMQTKMRHRTRHLVGYGSTPVMIRPGLGGDLPMWEVLNPMSVFAAPVDRVDEITPSDVIVKRTRSRRWLLEHGYGDQVARVKDWKSNICSPDDQFTVLEYADAYMWCLILLGQGETHFSSPVTYGDTARVLHAVPNPMGVCPLVNPARITLDREQGQFDQALPMYEVQAKLMGLEIAAVEKGIWPDTYLVSRAGEVGRIIDGPYDGRSGKITVVAGGTIEDKTTNPGYQTNPTIDRLERAQRLTAGIPAEFGGESASNIRTGRRGQDVLQGVVEVPIQEAQELLAHSLEEENKRAVAAEKGLHGAATRSVYVTGLGNVKSQNYVPNEVFDTDVNKVTYPAVGTDLNGLVISMGQRVGIGMMSKRTGMELDPLVDDPEQEMDRVTAEALDASLLASIQQQASTGAIPPADLARIADLVRNDRLELSEAVTKVQAEAQARQATPAPEGAPELQPGLAMPGAGAEQPLAIPEPPESAQNLGQLFSALRQPAMMLGAEGG